MEKTKIILDCDPGHDDAVAITLAANSDKIDLLGITVVAGNQTLEKTQINARNVCQWLGVDVPVYAGCGQPMVREKMIAGDIHGETGLDGPVFPPLTKELERACSQFHHQNPDGVRRRYHDGDNRSDDQSGDGDADGTGDYSEDQTDRPDGRRVYQW